MLQIVGLVAAASAARADSAPVAEGTEDDGGAPAPLATATAPPSTSAPAAPTTTTAPDDPPPVTSTVPAPTPAPATEPVASPQPAPRPTPPAPPAPHAPPAPPSMSPVERLQHRLDVTVPARWRGAIAVRLEVIAGSTSWGWPDGRIQISRQHADGNQAHLGEILAHEFGHVIAFRHGSGAYNGAAPAGWPEATANPAEHWADCVQQVFTGTVSASHGLPPCGGPQLAWARQYLAAGPTAG